MSINETISSASVNDTLPTSDDYLDSWAWSHVLDWLPGKELNSLSGVDRHLRGVVDEINLSKMTRMIHETQAPNEKGDKTGYFVEKCLLNGKIDYAFIIATVDLNIPQAYKQKIAGMIVQHFLDRNDLPGALKGAHLYREGEQLMIQKICDHLTERNQFKEAKTVAQESSNHFDAIQLTMGILKKQFEKGDCKGAMDAIPQSFSSKEKSLVYNDFFEMSLKSGNLELAKQCMSQITTPHLRENAQRMIEEKEGLSGVDRDRKRESEVRSAVERGDFKTALAIAETIGDRQIQDQAYTAIIMDQRLVDLKGAKGVASKIHDPSMQKMALIILGSFAPVA